MSEAIKNRYDFMLVFDVKDGNPNGDPDAGNLPRVDAETGQGLITDVCLKRKVRNYIQLTKGAEVGYDIYVKEKAILSHLQAKAFNRLGIDVGQEAAKVVPNEYIGRLEDLTLCEGLSIREDDDDQKWLVAAPDADKKEIKKWLKETFTEKKDLLSKFISDLLKEAKPRKATADESEQGKKLMCATYFDIRTFGAVMSLKTANCGQVRGPVQLTFARSVDPVVTLEHSITRMAVATEAVAEKQGGDNRTMGRKNTIPYGLYVAYGFVSPALANQTGFSQEDLDELWKALVGMFDQDHSAARGLMATEKLVIFKHETALGNAPSHRLFDLVNIVRKADVIVPRKFSDYEVTIDRSSVPSGVEVIEM